MGSLLAYDDDFVATLGSLCGQFSHLRAALGTLWEHLRHIVVTWGHFGIILGSVWVSVGDFASLDGHFAIIVESPWVYKRSVSEKHSFSQQISTIL